MRSTAVAPVWGNESRRHLARGPLLCACQREAAIVRRGPCDPRELSWLGCTLASGCTSRQSLEPVSLLTAVCVARHGFDVLFLLDVALRQCSAHACQAVDITTGSIAGFASISKALGVSDQEVPAPSSRALSCDGQRLSPQSRT